jgi:hypothetical protein
LAAGLDALLGFGAGVGVGPVGASIGLAPASIDFALDVLAAFVGFELGLAAASIDFALDVLAAFVGFELGSAAASIGFELGSAAASVGFEAGLVAGLVAGSIDWLAGSIALRSSWIASDGVCLATLVKAWRLARNGVKAPRPAPMYVGVSKSGTHLASAADSFKRFYASSVMCFDMSTS